MGLHCHCRKSKPSQNCVSNKVSGNHKVPAGRQWLAQEVEVVVVVDRQEQQQRRQ